ncbi:MULTISPECIES: hypothetical protein [Mesonia]|uniref:Uncharacterized protein n=1 Tax=Mesonia oceanica TaxID=2687242 RepID=A0AC61Y501_9FLAO|nr:MULTISPECIES: hypothetical protein [Mesonia]MAN27736.1 hypothetical protein [Mesonia sp.]MAQ39661.1 hypothetical protein [Mesonia sp.]VVU99578.1 hypothetical protein FVB9532_00833 [Mesonia oceanica]
MYAQSDNYFKLTFEKKFIDGEANQVAYINFPDIVLWGYFEVTITGGYNHRLNKGILKKRFAMVRNTSNYFSDLTEVPIAFGVLADQWCIGDFDENNLRIPIYHLSSAGNEIVIQVEGLIRKKSNVDAIIANLNISDPVIVSNSKTRQYMSIIQDRVGIGTNNPQNKLELANLNHDGINLDNKFRLRTFGTSNTFILEHLADEGDLYIRSKIGPDDSGNIVMNDAGGNVLIGQTTQQNSDYRLDIDGPVRANEIKINLDGADFVFEPNYELRSLKEVEIYVKENKRLPEIASAEEMKKGANVGELSRQLLQKTEELTLYTIQQHKEIKKLNNELTELKKVIVKLN